VQEQPPLGRKLCPARRSSFCHPGREDEAGGEGHLGRARGDGIGQSGPGVYTLIVAPHNGREPKLEPAGLTQLLRQAAQVNLGLPEQVLPLVYEQLAGHRRQRMADGARRSHAPGDRAVVHEVYQRIMGTAEISWADRAHFYNIAAEAMRRLLIEHARKRGRIKRGGERQRVP